LRVPRRYDTRPTQTCPPSPRPCRAQLLPSAPRWFPYYALLCVARGYVGELPRWVALTVVSCILCTPIHEDADAWAAALPVALLPWALALRLDSVWSATGARPASAAPLKRPPVSGRKTSS
jgi:hypothetical protein